MAGVISCLGSSTFVLSNIGELLLKSLSFPTASVSMPQLSFITMSHRSVNIHILFIYGTRPNAVMYCSGSFLCN